MKSKVEPGFWLSFVTCTFLILASCTPPQSAIETAIAETETARSTETPTSTHSPNFTPSNTSTPNPTPDLRVIDINPQDLLLQTVDFPADAAYYLPGPDWIRPYRNVEVVAELGAEGQEFLERTGRVDGWIVNYKRGSSAVIAPGQIFDNVTLFRTREGAIIFFEEYNTYCTGVDENYDIVDTTLGIGDASMSCISRVFHPSGEYLVSYLVFFVYRNITHRVVGGGWEREVMPEYVEQIAETLLSRLQAASLSNVVTFTP